MCLCSKRKSTSVLCVVLEIVAGFLAVRNFLNMTLDATMKNDIWGKGKFEKKNGFYQVFECLFLITFYLFEYFLGERKLKYRHSQKNNFDNLGLGIG